MTTTQPRTGPASRVGLDRRPVVVGVDGSTGSTAALNWAAREALSRGCPLTLVHTWEWDMVQPWSFEEHDIENQLQDAGRRILAAGQDQARTAGVEDVTTANLRGYGPDIIAELSTGAALIVLGSRHLTALGRAVLSSVSTAAVNRSSCPVVVLSGAPAVSEERAEVVVGVAGGPHDEKLLAFGFDHADRHGLPLRAVFCWDPPLSNLKLPPPEQARLKLAEVVAGWREQYPQLDVHYIARRGHPSAALVHESASQALLVVGKHARRMRFGAWLGSVSLAALHHATCPVAVIPPGSEPDGEPTVQNLEQ
jgi:nucleotide-binding universal stress UspA family protein